MLISIFSQSNGWIMIMMWMSIQEEILTIVWVTEYRFVVFYIPFRFARPVRVIHKPIKLKYCHFWIHSCIHSAEECSHKIIFEYNYGWKFQLYKIPLQMKWYYLTDMLVKVLKCIVIRQRHVDTWRFRETSLLHEISSFVEKYFVCTMCIQILSSF